MANELVDAIVAGYGTFWAGLNTYTFYPIVKKKWNDLRSNDEHPYDDWVETLMENDPAALPTFDVFIPAYEEADVIHQAIGSANQMTYPDNRVSIHAVVEKDDDTTQAALTRLEDNFSFDTIIVPDSYPGEKNKPRALNYAFNKTDADIVGVFDAEDIADPEFLTASVSSLDDYDYAQGHLDMVNEDDGWLNALFRGEYNHWYGTQLPAYHEADYPVPLGGTSNVFWRDVLEDVSDIRRGNAPRHQPQEKPLTGTLAYEDAPERFDEFEEWLEKQDTEDPVLSPDENIYDAVRIWAQDHDVPDDMPWDPENVTEDFELGLLLWEHDYDMAYLDTVTTEESPQRVRDWLKQRTRWQKGKIQTAKKKVHDPPEGLRTKAHIYAQSAMPHIGPINATGVGLTGYELATHADSSPVTRGLLLLGAAGVGAHMAAQGYAYNRDTDEENSARRAGRTVLNSVGLPFYWVLQWAGDARGLKQGYIGDGGWERTPHHGIDAGDQWQQETDAPEDIWNDIHSILDRKPGTTRAMITNVLLPQYLENEDDFSGTRNYILSRLDTLPIEAYDTPRERAYMTDDETRSALFAAELSRFDADLSEDERDSLTGYATVLKENAEDEVEEEDAESGGFLKSIQQRVTKYLPGQSQKPDETQQRQKQIEAQIRQYLNRSRQADQELVIEYLIPRYVTETGSYGDERSVNIDHLRSEYSEDYDNLAVLSDEDVQKNLFEHELKEYAPDLSEADVSTVITYVHELREMEVPYEVDETLAPDERTDTDEQPPANDGGTIVPASEESAVLSQPVEEWTGPEHSRTVPDAQSLPVPYEEQDEPTNDVSEPVLEEEHEASELDADLPKPYVDDDIVDKYVVVDEFISTGHNRYQKVETDDGFEYLKNGSPVSQHAYAGGAAHKLPGESAAYWAA